MCPTNLKGTSPDCSLGADVVSCSWGTDSAKSHFMEKVIGSFLISVAFFDVCSFAWVSVAPRRLGVVCFLSGELMCVYVLSGACAHVSTPVRSCGCAFVLGRCLVRICALFCEFLFVSV
jgi:hypothetical protein